MDQRIADAIELLEDFLLLARWNADAVIDHFKLDRAVIAVQLHAHILFIGRILERVVHQVQQRARNRLAVNPDPGKIVGDLLLEGEAVLFDLVSIGLERVVRQLANIGFTKIVLFLARLDAGKVKNVVDKSGQPFALFADDGVVFLVFLAAAQAAHLQGFGVKPDQRQRSSQFVSLGVSARLRLIRLESISGKRRSRRYSASKIMPPTVVFSSGSSGACGSWK